MREIKIDEYSYAEGSQRAWIFMLQICLKHIDTTDQTKTHPLFEKSRLILERAEAIQQLRSLCADFGDNDWDDNLHLADIIEKHLGKHLYK